MLSTLVTWVEDPLNADVILWVAFCAFVYVMSIVMDKEEE